MAQRSVLFVHRAFPGQFPHIIRALLARGDRIAAIGGKTAKEMPGVDLRRAHSPRNSTPGIFDLATRAEADLIRALGAAEEALALKRAGFEPDLIIGHPGWGETIHLKDVFPRARLILLGEHYLRFRGGDGDFDPEFADLSPQRMMLTNGRNATLGLALTMADQIVCPTPYQASTFPSLFRPRICVLHEGVDTAQARPRSDARITLADGRMLDSAIPVVTYVSRSFEPLRGFHIFMRALPDFLTAVPEAHVLVIGSDRIAYGAPAPGVGSWLIAMRRELGERIDVNRVHFLGPVAHDHMVTALSIGRAHVYYSYPFVLSWSLLEAMACECLILGSDTAPLHDAITPGVDGLVHDFFDVAALGRAMVDAVRARDRFVPQRKAARETVLARFDQATGGTPGWLRLIDEMLA